MPATSEARIAANRRNARGSTGPKTPEGKARSRRNGLKHGLSGSGVVLAEEDVAEVESRAGALLAELDPSSGLGVILVGQIATLSVRMERGARQEEAALASRVRHAAGDFDRRRVDRAEALFGSLADDPRLVARELRGFPEGVDRLVEAWAGLRADLTRAHLPGWYDQHRVMAALLAGLTPEQAGGTRFHSLSRLSMGDPATPEHPECATMGHDARKAWARARLLEAVDAELAALAAHRATLDLGAIELDRRGAADVALFDASREATLARRYESEARRGFFRALGEFRRVEAEALEQAAAMPEPEDVEAEEPEAEEVEAPEPLASSWAGPRTPPRRARESSAGGPARPAGWPDGAPRGLDGRVVAAGRAVPDPR